MTEVHKRICVFGASSSSIPESCIDFAYSLGELLAKNDMGLVFGAGRSGLMGACARGAHSGNGEIIGIIPEKLNIPGIYYEYCTERIETPTMHQRKALMDEKADAFVALPGGFGTIEELMKVMTLKQLGYHNKPIVIANIDDYYSSLLGQFACCVRDGYTNKEFLKLYSVANTPEEVIKEINSHASLVTEGVIEEALRERIGSA